MQLGGKIGGARTMLEASPRPSPHHAERSRDGMANAHRTPKENLRKTCIGCGVEFLADAPHRKFHNKGCYWRSLIASVEPKPCAMCGQLMARKQFTAVREAPAQYRERKFCSRACQGLAHRVDQPALRTLRNRAAAAVRRAAKCAHCGRSDRRLDRHHVDEDKSNNAPENVLTLCASCHTRHHWRTGKLGRRRSAAPQ